jgi:DNA-binding beta-propeller fold protein YncE
MAIDHGLFLLDTTYGDVVEFPTAPINAPPVFYTPQPDGVALFSPWGLAVDYAGNLFIADVGNTRVVEVPAGGGAAVAIQAIVNGLGVHPANVAVDGVGNLYIADSSFPSPTPRVVEVLVGGGPAFAIQPVVNGYL